MKEDHTFIDHCAVLAARGYARVSGNPPVGALIVKDKKVIASGFHGEHGADHAEVVAISKCRESLVGATLYVSLEPCKHHGKTPPCVDAIIKSGLRSVVYAESDPHVVAAGGASKLLDNGIEVRKVSTMLSQLVIEPWVRFITLKKKRLEVFALLSLNGNDVSGYDDEWVKSYAILLSRVQARTVQLTVSTPDEIGLEYHVGVLYKDFNTFDVWNDNGKHQVYLNVVRIPYFNRVAEGIAGPAYIDPIKGRLLSVKRYKSGFVERYQMRN